MYRAAKAFSTLKPHRLSITQNIAKLELIANSKDIKSLEENINKKLDASTSETYDSFVRSSQAQKTPNFTINKELWQNMSFTSFLFREMTRKECMAFLISGAIVGYIFCFQIPTIIKAPAFEDKKRSSDYLSYVAGNHGKKHLVETQED